MSRERPDEGLEYLFKCEECGVEGPRWPFSTDGLEGARGDVVWHGRQFHRGGLSLMSQGKLVVAVVDRDELEIDGVKLRSR